MQYLKNPADIYAKSFSIVRSEACLDHIPEDLQDVVIRLMHASGMTDLAAFVRFDERIAPVTQAALNQGAKILTDSEMTASAIIRRTLPANNRIICKINSPVVQELATRNKTTRSAAAVELWEDYISNSVVVIGNAPTALFSLLELLDKIVARPHAIFAFPVGFVGASESKQALNQNPRGVPFMTLLGRRGGSAMAGAAVNALTGSLSSTTNPQNASDLTEGDVL